MERGSSNAVNKNSVKDKRKSNDLKSAVSFDADENVDQCIDVMFICSEWGSSKGGLSTFNRELALNLAKYSKDRIRTHCYVCQSTEEERQDASRNGIHLITARRSPGFSDPLEWIKIPPSDLPNPDIVIGHGRKFGGAAFFISDRTKCKWIHFVHVFCEDLGKYKLESSVAADAIADNEEKNRRELELCKASDMVVAVGSLLQRKYQRKLPDIKVEVITPGIFEKFVNPTEGQWKKFESSGEEEFQIFMFGRGSFEDFELKGYDIIGKAVALLERKFELTFVGAAQDEQRKIEKWFIEETKITRNQLTIRGFCNYEETREIFREADAVVMPSRTEGFGLVALEAISAGVPLLVSRECGIAKALQTLDGGMAVIVPSASPEEWAKRIQKLSRQTADQRRASAVDLRENYRLKYNWKKESEKFEKMILQLASSPIPKEREITEKAVCSLGETMETHKKESLIVLTATDDVPHSSLELGKTERNEQRESAPGKIPHSSLEAGKIEGNEQRESARENFECRSNGTDGIHKKESGTVLTATGKAPHRSVDCGETEKNKQEQTVSGLSVDSKDAEGTTPLMNAAMNGNAQAVERLVKRGADPSLINNRGWNLLHFAAKGGDTDVIDLIHTHLPDMESKTAQGSTPLMVAALNGKLRAVKWFLGKGANVTSVDNNRWNMLHFAAQGGDTDVIDLIHTHLPDMESKTALGYTPLMVAASTAKLQAVKWFLEKGANVTCVDNERWNILHCAAQGGDTDVIDLIHTHLLDIESQTASGCTPLIIAVLHGKLQGVKSLLEKGANPLARDNGGKDSLHYALSRDVDFVDLLLSHVANNDNRH